MQLILLSLLLLACWPGLQAKSGAVSGTAAGCVHWKAEARPEGMGFRHYVQLDNRCDVAMCCEVTTSVNNNPITVDIPAHSSRTITTSTDSPSSEFETHVRCWQRGAQPVRVASATGFYSANAGTGPMSLL